MNLTLTRVIRAPGRTFGTLQIDGALECLTLEDEDRLARGEAKIRGETAIPAGRYLVKMTLSDRFKRITPELQDVPGFTGVRIHPGNTPADTDGCILPGQLIDLTQIYNSKRAFDPLFAKLLAVPASESIYLTVV